MSCPAQCLLKSGRISSNQSQEHNQYLLKRCSLSISSSNQAQIHTQASNHPKSISQGLPVVDQSPTIHQHQLQTQSHMAFLLSINLKPSISNHPSASKPIPNSISGGLLVHQSQLFHPIQYLLKPRRISSNQSQAGAPLASTSILLIESI